MGRGFGLVAGLTVLALGLGIPSTGRAKEEPPNTDIGEHLVGPALVGTLKLKQTGIVDGLPFLEGSFTGWSCKGQAGGEVVVEGSSPVSIADLQPEHLVDFRVDGVGAVNASVPDCYQSSGQSVLNGQLIVNTVVSFSNAGGEVTATLVVMAIGVRN